jgi:hypothetical protein
LPGDPQDRFAGAAQLRFLPPCKNALKSKPLAKIISEEHKAVLLVVIGDRQKAGVSKARVGEILGLDAFSYLDDLLPRSPTALSRSSHDASHNGLNA